MRKKRSLPLFIILGLIIAVSLPLTLIKRLRSDTAAFFCTYFSAPEKKLAQEELLRRQIERLKSQNASLKAKVIRLVEELKTSALFTAQQELAAKLDLQRRRDELVYLLTLQHDGVHAAIIFRPITTWNSGFWVDVGACTNERLGYTAVAKNSPVLHNGHLIGVVDEVTATSARICLITDPSLTLSVRASRSDALLAKGELYGSASSPLWQRGSLLLQGRGFNYDFEDAEGPSHDLRSKEPVLIKQMDLLVTTGLDGLFPAGLAVARVKEIAPLKEGDYAYSLTAEALENLDDLHTVFILPPLSTRI